MDRRKIFLKREIGVSVSYEKNKAMLNADFVV